MNYTTSNTIDASLEEVSKNFLDADGVKHWMEGLERIEHLSGTPRKFGAKSDFYFLHKGKK